MSKPLVVSGSINLQGDKSLSHRAAILASLAKGQSKLINFLEAEDTLNTLKIFEALGVKVSKIKNGTYQITSSGLDSLEKNINKLDVGNSGTSARLLIGLFAGLPSFSAQIDGDKSLRKRPMARVLDPLKLAGAKFSDANNLPLEIYGQQLAEINFEEKLGSAQVKSAMMLSAISSNVKATIVEHIPSRDHSENMLGYAGVNLTISESENKNTICMHPPYEIQAKEYNIWGDASSASFFCVLACLASEGEIKINNVLLNPHRDAFIWVLRQMNADIEIIKKEKRCGENGGDLIIRPAKLKGFKIPEKIIPGLIDELPILTIAGLFCEGEFSFRGAKELRVKESDRITSLVTNLKNLGVAVTEHEDGLSLAGESKRNLHGKIESFMDHRIVMSFEIASLVSQANGSAPLEIEGSQWIKTSFPEFYNHLKEVCHE